MAQAPPNARDAGGTRTHPFYGRCARQISINEKPRDITRGFVV
jgi:hypothetical protein